MASSYWQFEFEYGVFSDHAVGGRNASLVPFNLARRFWIADG